MNLCVDLEAFKVKPFILSGLENTQGVTS